MTLPEKSRKNYEATYKAFMDWRSLQDDKSFSESLILNYFEELSKTYSSSSLWAYYSMLRSTLIIHKGINIESYIKLRGFLKRNSKGYIAKKAKIFTPEEINTFINEAPDIIYLVTKVALIMGVMGACRANELRSLTIDDIQDLGSAMLVSIPDSKNNSCRQFTLTGQYYNICRHYADLRPSNAPSTAFFLNYQNGKCTLQNIGRNKLGGMGKQIARFLNLPNQELYSGRSFRRSSSAMSRRRTN